MVFYVQVENVSLVRRLQSLGHCWALTDFEEDFSMRRICCYKSPYVLLFYLKDHRHLVHQAKNTANNSYPDTHSIWSDFTYNSLS